MRVFRAKGVLQLPELGDLTMTQLVQSEVGTYFALAGRGEFSAESLGLPQPRDRDPHPRARPG